MNLYRGDVIPDIAPFAVLLFMGGPMDVWEEAARPWLAPKRLATPTGADLVPLSGHQLLVEAMGGKCDTMGTPEIGLMPITVAKARG